MCGISTLYRFTEITEDDKQKLVAMNHEMHYRGPDGEGYWNDDTCAMAHTRLSIIGLDNGQQPLFNADKSLVLVCNGEIYNYKELRSQLAEKGYGFATDSDCEPILYLYELYGTDCLKHLRGMFAFCLYDVKRKRMFAARDRVGEKKLYYAQLTTGYVFSTELKAILKYYIDLPQLNAFALAESMRYNFPIEQRQTFVEQIKRLQAGEYAVVDMRGLHLHTYWERHCLSVFEGSKEEAKEEMVRLMRESVAHCLQSDVPVAVLLSGGIDSSAIATFAKETGKEIHTITAGYKGGFAQDERAVAKRFAKDIGLVYHEIELDADDFRDCLDEYIPRLDEPVCDVSSMSQYALYKKAKELGFTVLLSGIGPDELFYGYDTENELASRLKLRKQHQDIFPWKGCEKKMEFIKFMMENWRFVLFASYPLKIYDYHPICWVYDDYSKFAASASLGIWGEDFDLSKVDVHHSYPVDADLDTVYELMYSCFMRNLCLYLSDRLGMANSVEIRSPFVDYKFVEFVTSLPQEMKYNGTPKGLYKESLRGIVPDYILDAQKRGFEPPWDYINEMNKQYQPKLINTDYVFFNTVLADKLLLSLKDK